ncbi:MAG: hydantoinase B/oxoprolinase family protein [Solirubrobacteraceae bacterium]
MSPTAMPPSSIEQDPVLPEIIRNYELTMNREMGRALVNLSGSFLFVSASDFACGCLDAEGRILTSIAWTLQMGYSTSNTVRSCLQRFGEDLHPGDVIFANDPYDGGGLHSHDVVVVAPVFDEAGGPGRERLVMWVGVSAHVTDVGGAEPGGFAVEPMDVYGENVRFTPVKFYERGRFRADILDAFLTNTRSPKQTGIDLKALMGAVWIGRGRLGELIARHGGERIEAIHAAQIEASGRAFRARLSKLPDGVYQGASHMEHDGREDRVFTIRATVTKEGEQLTFDYSRTDQQSVGAINCTDVGGTGSIMAALGTVLAPDIPFNEGLMEAVEVVSPKGTLMNAIKPAPISAATVYAGWFGTDAVLEALNYLIAGHPDTAQRRTGPWGCWTFAWLQSLNQYDEPWFWNVFTGGAGGAGAMQSRDGQNAMMGIQTVDAFAPNVEEYEQQSPVLFLQTGLARDSGGVGRHRGGLAPETLCVPYGVDSWNVTVFQNRMSTPASAVSGGSPGAGAAISFARGIMYEVRARLESHEELPIEEYALHAEHPPARARGFQVGSNDCYYIRATGGPGYGDPLEREPEAVLADVQRGFVSPELAEEAYGVAVLDGGELDLDATRALRERAREVRRYCPRGLLALPVGDGSGGTPQRRPPLPGAGTQVLGEYLAIDAEGHYHCRRCNHRLAANTTNWKWWALCAEAHVEPSVIHNSIVVRRAGELMFRRYHCPGCAVQIDSEVALAGEPPRWNFRPLGVEA